MALSEAKRETELSEDSSSIKSKSKNCPVKPPKHDLKSGVFTGIGRRFFSRRERLYAQVGFKKKIFGNYLNDEALSYC